MSKAKSGIEKKCPHCGALFYVQAHRATKAVFCSMQCLWAGRKRRPIQKADCTCEQCGKTYSVRKYRADKSRFCSHRCQRIALLPIIEGPRIASLKRPRPKMTEEERLSRRRECSRRRYNRDPEASKRKQRETYAQNKERHKERQRKWREENQDKVSESNRRKRAKNGDVMRANRRQHYRDNKARYKAQAVARMDRIKRATPPWADLEKIAVIYAEADRLSIETGTPHHVDHYYPLRGKTMCGLHVEGNLRIIPKLDNLRKGNSVPIGISGMIGI